MSDTEVPEPTYLIPVYFNDLKLMPDATIRLTTAQLKAFTTMLRSLPDATPTTEAKEAENDEH